MLKARYAYLILIFLCVYFVYSFLLTDSILSESGYDPHRFLYLAKTGNLPLGDVSDLLSHILYGQGILDVVLFLGHLHASGFDPNLVYSLILFMSLFLLEPPEKNSLLSYWVSIFLTPALPFLLETGKDGITVVACYFVYFSLSYDYTSRKLLVGIFAILFLSLGIYVRGVTFLMFVCISFFLSIKGRKLIFKYPCLPALTLLLAAVFSIFFVSPPDLDSMLQGSALPFATNPLFVTTSLSPLYVFQVGFRFYGYLLTIVLAPFSQLYKLFNGYQFYLVFSFIATTYCAVFIALKTSFFRRLPLVSIIYPVLMIAFSYRFLHYRYLFVVLPLVFYSLSIDHRARACQFMLKV